jgi:uncharacterized membrane protein YphA (DoxX/SURF4 family)
VWAAIDGVGGGKKLGMVTAFARPARLPQWLWIAGMALSAAAALWFLDSGVMKLAHEPHGVSGFAKFGYPTWFYYLIGCLETAAGITLWVPRMRLFGALLGTLLMLGALTTLVTHGAAEGAWRPLLLLALLLVGTSLRGDWNAIKARRRP